MIAVVKSNKQMILDLKPDFTRFDCVYAIKCHSSIESIPAFIKIGRSNNVFYRLSSLQTANPYKLTLVGVNATMKEQEHHRNLRNWMYSGEWYVLSDAVQQYLETNFTAVKEQTIDSVLESRMEEMEK